MGHTVAHGPEDIAIQGTTSGEVEKTRYAAHGTIRVSLIRIFAEMDLSSAMYRTWKHHGPENLSVREQRNADILLTMRIEMEAINVLNLIRKPKNSRKLFYASDDRRRQSDEVRCGALL